MIGASLGRMSLHPEAFGLDVAFPAIFLGLVLPAVRARQEWLTAGVAALLALAGRAVLPEGPRSGGGSAGASCCFREEEAWNK